MGNRSTWTRFSVQWFVFFSFLITIAGSQQIQDDTLHFDQRQDWADMRSCLRCLFNCLTQNVASVVGCNTNKCFCRPSTLGQALEYAADFGMQLCSNYDDVYTATSYIYAYCSEKGYTSVVAAGPASESTNAVTITTEGAFTVTAMITTEITVTQTVVPTSDGNGVMNSGAAVDRRLEPNAIWVGAAFAIMAGSFMSLSSI